MLASIELRQALISYQANHMLLLTLAGKAGHLRSHNVCSSAVPAQEGSTAHVITQARHVANTYQDCRMSLFSSRRGPHFVP